MDKGLRGAIIIGILLVGVSFAYYFLYRPMQDRRAFEECFAVLNETGAISSITSTSEKNFQIDTCAKSRNADEIRNKYELEKMAKDVEEAAKENEIRRQATEELERREAVKLSSFEFDRIQILNLNTDFNRNGLSNKEVFDVVGSIKNSNPFDIKNVVIHFNVTSDKAGKNKISESVCRLESGIDDFIVYSNTTKKFNEQCSFEKGGSWYFYTLQSAEKAF